MSAFALVVTCREEPFALYSSFAEFFAARINEQATLVNRPLHLEPMPVVCVSVFLCFIRDLLYFTQLRAKPTDKVQCVNAYRRLRDEYTSCIVVVHVLPGQDTKDFREFPISFPFYCSVVFPQIGCAHSPPTSASCVKVYVWRMCFRGSATFPMAPASARHSPICHTGWHIHTIRWSCIQITRESWLLLLLSNDQFKRRSPDGVRLRLATKNEYFEPDEGEESAFEQETNRVEIKEKTMEATDLNYDIHINDMTAAVWKTLHGYVDHSGFAMFGVLPLFWTSHLIRALCSATSSRVGEPSLPQRRLG